jgi:Flp pilus assembly pilin Flp
MLHQTMEEGQGLAEYAFIIVLMAIAVVISLTLFSEEVERLYEIIRVGVLGARQKGLPDPPPVPGG